VTISLWVVSALIASGPTISLGLSTTRTEILVGEPLKLVVTASTTSLSPLRLKTTAIYVAIDDGTGYRRHIEAADQDDSVDLGIPIVAGTESVKTTFYIGAVYRGRGYPFPGFRDFHFALGASGTYKVRAHYYEEAASNEVTVHVSAPQGRDADLYQQLAQRPYLLTNWVTFDEVDLDLLRQILREHVGSPYLFRPQLVVWRVAIQRALVAFGDSGGPARGGHPLNEELGQILREIEATDWAGSPYDENRLALLAESRLEWGDRTGAVDTYRLILTRYPNDVMATLAKRVIQQEGIDATPPTLQVSASPSTLWPPNSKLVSVTLTVNVTDETDPSPSVTLLSITCDDACNPSQDIVGAALNTDDRSFQLRAKRGGGGSGRTYTITYVAKDASGNSTAARTPVTVPHDQGH